VTLQEALAIAAWAKPKQPGRIPMDKLQRGTAAAQLSAGVTALGKSYATMGSNLSGMTKQLSQVAADVVLLENHPHAPWRLN
jgi:hypothetical protein